MPEYLSSLSENPAPGRRQALFALLVLSLGCGGRPAGSEEDAGTDAQIRPFIQGGPDCVLETSTVSITEARLLRPDIITLTLAGYIPECPGHLKIGLAWSPTPDVRDATISSAGIAYYDEVDSSLQLRFFPEEARGARYVGLVVYPEIPGFTTTLVPLIREEGKRR